MQKPQPTTWLISNRLACYTQEEVAEAVGCDQSVVSDLVKGFMDFGKLAESHKAAANHLVDGKTQQEIAEVFGITRQAVSKILGIENINNANSCNTNTQNSPTDGS